MAVSHRGYDLWNANFFCVMSLPARYVGHTLGAKTAPVVLEAFIDLVCPFSKRIYPKLKQIVDTYKDAVQVRIHFWIQPWHGQSCYLARSAEVIGMLKPAKVVQFTDQMYENMDSFLDEKVDDQSPNQLYERTSAFAVQCGIAKDEFLKGVRSGAAIKAVKYTQKYGRQNGIHVSPTVLINGLITDTSSGWDLDKWKELLDPVVKEALSLQTAPASDGSAWCLMTHDD